MKRDDVLLSEADEQEALSLAYAYAVAARARYSTSRPDLDRDGIDLRIQTGGPRYPALELQLKATVNLARTHDGRFRFRLKRRNYDLLRARAQTPRLLVVLDLPRERCRWLSIGEDELVLRHCAYWANLQGLAASGNKSSVTVYIRASNVFDVENLQSLMEQSRKGEL